jgi:ABC-type transport system substrate-binding protein
VLGVAVRLLAVLVPLLVVATFAVFLLLQLTSADPAVVRLGDNATAESQYAERHAPGSPYDVLKTDRGDVAELADKALNASTPEAQAAAWRDVYTYLIEQGYLMVVGHEIPTIVVGKDVSGAKLGPSDNLPKPYGMAVG